MSRLVPALPVFYSHDLFVSLIEAFDFFLIAFTTYASILTIYSWASLKHANPDRWHKDAELFSRSIREPHWSERIYHTTIDCNRAILTIYSWASLKPTNRRIPRRMLSTILTIYSWASLKRNLLGARLYLLDLFSRSIREPHWSSCSSRALSKAFFAYSHDLFVSLIEATPIPASCSLDAIYSHDLFVSLIEAGRWCQAWPGTTDYSHDLFVSLIEAQRIPRGVFVRFSDYSHDLFVSLIEADKVAGDSTGLYHLFSRSIREPHWSKSHVFLCALSPSCSLHPGFGKKLFGLFGCECGHGGYSSGKSFSTSRYKVEPFICGHSHLPSSNFFARCIAFWTQLKSSFHFSRCLS